MAEQLQSEVWVGRCGCAVQVLELHNPVGLGAAKWYEGVCLPYLMTFVRNTPHPLKMILIALIVVFRKKWFISVRSIRLQN